MADPEGPCAVYRAFDADGQLLYVGIATNWGRRWAQHAERSAFFDSVARLELSWFPTAQHAHAEELRLIAELNPPFNNHGRTNLRRRPCTLLCDQCGCMYASLSEPEWVLGASCNDWRCRCGAVGCFPAHCCGGTLRAADQVPNAAALRDASAVLRGAR